MKRFVENQQLGVLYESPCHENDALLAARQMQERTLGQVVDAKETHPPQTLLTLFTRRTDVEPDGVFQSAGYDVKGRQVAVVAAVHLG